VLESSSRSVDEGFDVVGEAGTGPKLLPKVARSRAHATGDVTWVYQGLVTGHLFGV